MCSILHIIVLIINYFDSYTTSALNDYVIFHVYRFVSSDRKREAKAHGLLQSLYSGMYPEFTGMEGPTDDTDPKDNSAPPKGSYNFCSSNGNNYFVFHDRKVVSFVTNVFPQSMKGKVYREQVGRKS